MTNDVVAFLVTVDCDDDVRVMGVDRVTCDGMLGFSGGVIGGANARVEEDVPLWIGRGAVMTLA